MDFARDRNGNGHSAMPIPITRTSTGPMNIPGHYTDRTSVNKTNISNYSQSMPLPRAPIIGSLPAPTSVRFEQMPTLELPPSFKEDEIARSFGAPGTSLGSNHRGYAASCPAPSFMMQASSRRRRGEGGEDLGGENQSSDSFDQSHARTPSYNTPSMGSRTVLSVLLETDETEYQDEKNGSSSGGGSGGSSSNGGSSKKKSGSSGGGSGTSFNTNMEIPIALEKLDLQSTKGGGDSTRVHQEEEVPEDDFDSDDGGLFQMDTE